MSDFYVFYCRHRTGDEIASHAPVPMAMDRIAALAGDVLEENGDFLGLVDGDDCVLQFIYLASSEDDARPIRMELPDVQRRQDLIRYISNVELCEILNNLPDQLTIDVMTKADVRAPGP